MGLGNRGLTFRGPPLPLAKRHELTGLHMRRTSGSKEASILRGFIIRGKGAVFGKLHLAECTALSSLLRIGKREDKERH